MKKRNFLIDPILKRKRRLQIGIIILIGLIPLLWFKRGYLIGGVDFDFPLYPIRQFFISKFTWNQIFLGGSDRSMCVSSGITFLGLQAILKAVGLSLFSLQKIYLTFWYTLTGLSMYFCMSQLVRGKDIKSQIIKFLGTFFYMINFYQLHIWMIAREGELSGTILIPVTLGLLIRSFREEISYKKVALIYPVFVLLSIGIGVQPPVIGIFIFAIFSCFVFYVISNVRQLDKKYLFRQLSFLSLLGIIFLSINMSWILANINYILNSGYLTTSRSLDVFNIMGLLEATSRYNSFLNVFRLYGDNIWFDGFKNRLYLPFFANYLNNPFLVAASFIFPILAFSAILISKKKHVIFFTLMALITLFLSKGIHSPFGNVFLWMIKHIPGFWVYRAPWQKFTLITILSYSYLAAVTCGYLYEKIPNIVKFSKIQIKHSKVIFLILLITIHLIYHYGFIFGRMLPTTEERQVLPGFHQKYPDYLFKSAEWINSKEDQFKMVLLPDDKANAYNWGYGGAYDISLKLFTKGLIFRQYGEGMAPPESLDRVYQIFISSLYNEITPYAGKIAGLLNVRYLLHRNDFIYDWSGDNDSPEFVKNKLSKQKGITLEKSIGKWDFYKNEYEFPHIYVPKNIIYVEGSLDVLPKLSYKEEFGPETAVLFSSMVGDENIDNLEWLVNYKFIISFREKEVDVRNGNEELFLWSHLKEGDTVARYYEGAKKVITTSGEKLRGGLSFSNPSQCPYVFRTESKEHTANSSTLIYIKTSKEPFIIDDILEEGQKIEDIVGIWWKDDWMGMGTKNIIFPVKIPANQKAIIQINHLIKNKTKLILETDIKSISRNLTKKKNEEIDIDVNKVNPTRYLIKAKNFNDNFLLVFNDKYHPQWKAYKLEIKNNKKIQPSFSALIDLFKFNNRVEIKNHIKANGYANGWIVDNEQDSILNEEDFTIMLEYIPQRFFEVGILSFLCMLGIGIFIIINTLVKKGNPKL